MNSDHGDRPWLLNGDYGGWRHCTIFMAIARMRADVCTHMRPDVRTNTRTGMRRVCAVAPFGKGLSSECLVSVGQYPAALWLSQ